MFTALPRNENCKICLSKCANSIELGYNTDDNARNDQIATVKPSEITT